MAWLSGFQLSADATTVLPSQASTGSGAAANMIATSAAAFNGFMPCSIILSLPWQDIAALARINIVGSHFDGLGLGAVAVGQHLFHRPDLPALRICMPVADRHYVARYGLPAARRCRRKGNPVIRRLHRRALRGGDQTLLVLATEFFGEDLGRNITCAGTHRAADQCALPI